MAIPDDDRLLVVVLKDRPVTFFEVKLDVVVTEMLHPGPSPRERAGSGAAPVEKSGTAMSSHCLRNAGLRGKLGADGIWTVDERDLIADRGTPGARGPVTECWVDEAHQLATVFTVYPSHVVADIAVAGAKRPPVVFNLDSSFGKPARPAPPRNDVGPWTTFSFTVDLSPAEVEGLKPIQDSIAKMVRAQLDADTELMLRTGWGLPCRTKR